MLVVSSLIPTLVQRFLSTMAVFVLCSLRHVKDHRNLSKCLPLLKKLCVRQVLKQCQTSGPPRLRRLILHCETVPTISDMAWLREMARHDATPYGMAWQDMAVHAVSSALVLSDANTMPNCSAPVVRSSTKKMSNQPGSSPREEHSGLKQD